MWEENCEGKEKKPKSNMEPLSRGALDRTNLGEGGNRETAEAKFGHG